ncbi:hypothetical protein [Abyssisolibacter fermentans]|uniref:hypothetical protein n=1 Tax=Abyssisolibacter fermentans TaxID=1766203 RepID=UPI00082FF811|nr:hypothetical protein [Abyssisolibacter fermentans]
MPSGCILGICPICKELIWEDEKPIFKDTFYHEDCLDKLPYGKDTKNIRLSLLENKIKKIEKSINKLNDKIDIIKSEIKIIKEE